MRLKQHLASHLRSQLGTWQSTDSWEVKSEVDRRHGEETALAVHHSVVMREGEGPSTSKSMTCDESYSWQWKVDDCGQQWEESFRVSIWIPVRLIKFKTCAPELGIVAFSYNSALTVRADRLPNSIECADELLTILAVQAVFRRLAHSD